MPTCPNCGTDVLDRRYCPQCGQEQGTLLPGFGRWIRGIVDELLFVDARLPRTVWLLVSRPGFLTREWAFGRRARYMAPIRLFLGAAVIFFFAYELAAERQGAYFADTIEGFLMGAQGAENLPDVEATARDLAARIVAAMRLLLPLASVPLLALLNRGQWSDDSDSLVLQLTFSLHVHAVALTALAGWIVLGRLWGALQDPDSILVPLGLLTAYHALALKGAFTSTWRTAIGRGVGVAMGYAISATLLAIAYATVPRWF